MPDQYAREDTRTEAEQRCDEQGHVWENCCSIFLQVYVKCKYCGKEQRHG